MVTALSCSFPVCCILSNPLVIISSYGSIIVGNIVVLCNVINVI